MLSVLSLTWTHSPSTTQCIPTCGTTSNRSVPWKTFIMSHGNVCLCMFLNYCYTFLLLSGSWKHTRYIYSWYHPKHHEPLDSSDGLPSGYYWHPDRKYQPETLPVGSRLCSGQALSVQVGNSFTLSCKFHVNKWRDWFCNAISIIRIHFHNNSYY